VSRASVQARFIGPEGALRVDARSGSGFDLVFDTTDAGAARAGASPTDAVLAALVACAAMDVAAILRKKRQLLDDYQIVAEGERTEEHPQVFTRIVVEHRVVGDVTPEALRRSIELSASRYCPVSAMLSSSVRIEHRYQLRDRDGSETADTVVVTGPGEGESAG
jgi:putative redox protein